MFSTGLAAVPDIEGNDLARRGIHRDPDPLAVRLLAHEAPELVRLGFQPMQDHSLGARCRLDIQIIWSRDKAFTHEI